MPSSIEDRPAITLRQTMRGHTKQVCGAVYLPDEERTITCSADGSLRLWYLKTGTQIGKDWRDGGCAVWSIALSPNGKIIASGSGGYGYNVKLWDVETGKVIAKWIGHTGIVCALCWSADGERVASGSWDGTARAWDVHVNSGRDVDIGDYETGWVVNNRDVDSDKPVLTIKTGHDWVNAVVYSPDSSKLATGGDRENAVKIWDAKTGKLLNKLEHYYSEVSSLAWTSDGQKLISGSYGLIRIFDTATWQQIATLEGHTDRVTAISLSWHNYILASASVDGTARLWNLDTNLPVAPPLQHENDLLFATLSSDGQVLVTACHDKNAYIWDVHAIKTAGHEYPLPIDTNIAQKERFKQISSPDDSKIQRTPRSSLSDKSFLEADATQYPGQFGGVDELSPAFFAGMEADVDSSPMGGAHPHSSVNALLVRLSSILHRFRPNNGETTEFPQPVRLSAFHPHALLARLSSFIHRSSPENDALGEVQQPPMHSRLDPYVFLARLSSLFPRSQLDTGEEDVPHPITPSRSRPGALSQLSSLFRSELCTNEEIELAQRPHHPPVVEVAAVRDRQALVVARGPQFKKAKRAYEQQTQSHGQAQASSSHTQPADASTSVTPPAPGTAAQPPPISWWARIVLFLCCASPPHANGH